MIGHGKRQHPNVGARGERAWAETRCREGRERSWMRPAGPTPPRARARAGSPLGRARPSLPRGAAPPPTPAACAPAPSAGEGRGAGGDTGCFGALPRVPKARAVPRRQAPWGRGSGAARGTAISSAQHHSSPSLPFQGPGGTCTPRSRLSVSARDWIGQAAAAETPRRRGARSGLGAQFVEDVFP